MQPRCAFPALLALAALGALPSTARAQEAPAGPAMVERAQAFLASLSPEQAKAARFAFDDPVRKDWHWIPKGRKGLTLGQMEPKQQEAALALLETALSKSGMEKARIIMGLEAVLKVQEKDDSGRRDPEKYHWCIFGEPSTKGRWGWSVEGHHVSVNVTVDDGKLVAATPLFFGACPRKMNAKIEGQPAPDYEALRNEEGSALTLVASLDEAQFKKAFQGSEIPNNLVAGPPSTLWDKAPVGIAAAELKPEQVETLRALLAAYCSRLTPEIGDPLLKEIEEADIGKVHLAWYGSKKAEEPHHYRVQGPTFLIDFDNTQADPLNNPANHIHSLWRSRTRDFGAGF